MHQLGSITTEALSRIQLILSDVYFKNLCAKLSNEILHRCCTYTVFQTIHCRQYFKRCFLDFHRYLELIVKAKGLTELATQQLMLDTYSMKSLMLRFPVINGSAAEVPSASYSKVITSRISQIESVLKIIGAPASALVERYTVVMSITSS